MSSANPTSRIVSMDQFRGYTVLGMLLVNFAGDFAAAWSQLKHGNGYFTLADSIMPSFVFCAGFSYRLTALRRFAELGPSRARWSYMRRSFALIATSIMIYGFNGSLGNWRQMTDWSKFGEAWQNFLLKFLKGGMWEILAIIGVTQLLLLPIIHRGFRTRLIAAVLFPLAHLWLSWWFNYNFAHRLPSDLDALVGRIRGGMWDGGFFGPISWALPMLAGTLTYDLVAARGVKRAWLPLLMSGACLMGAGYLSSCLYRLYDDTPETQELAKAYQKSLEDEQALVSSSKMTEKDREARSVVIKRKLEAISPVHAFDPVIPSWERLKSGNFGWGALPFVEVDGKDRPIRCYWWMDKHLVTLPFTLFGSGFAIFLYALFIPVCDLAGFQLGLFRVFGLNPLVAYIIHTMMMQAAGNLTPRDSPAWWLIMGCCFYIGSMYLILRHLEKEKLFLRL